MGMRMKLNPMPFPLRVNRSLSVPGKDAAGSTFISRSAAESVNAAPNPSID